MKGGEGQEGWRGPGRVEKGQEGLERPGRIEERQRGLYMAREGWRESESVGEVQGVLESASEG